MEDMRVVQDITEGRITPIQEHYSDNPDDPIFLRAQNIEEGQLNFTDAKRLLPESFKAEPKAILGDGDIVLTIDGVLLGIAAVHKAGEDACCVSNHMVRIRHGSEVTPEYLSWFLNSPVGQKQIKRGITGSAIPGVRADAIRRILVPIPSIEFQHLLVTDIEAAREARRRKLAQADELLGSLDGWLLEQLGLTSPQADKRNAYAIQLRAVLKTSRLNADYFHPERVLTIRTMEEQSGHLESAPLSEVVDFIRDARKAPEGKYLGLAHVQSHTGEMVEANEDAEGGCLAFQENDVLFARLRPYLNKVYCAEFSGVCSPEFHVLRIKDAKNLNPDYLATILRSSLIFAQTRHMMTGNTHPRLTNEDVVNLVVPIPDSNTQETIAMEVLERRQQARRLRTEVEAEWQAAKKRFEERLLTGSAP